MGLLVRTRKHLARLAGNESGAAAIEFAFVAPVLIVIYFMTMEVSQGLEANKKTSRIGIIVGDLITQQQTIDKASLDSIMRIGEAVVQPYNRSAPSIYVTGINISNDPTPEATVAWSRKLVDGAASSYLKVDDPTTVPEQLMIPGTFLVRTVSKLEYEPVLTWTASEKASLGLASAFDSIDMEEVYHLRPRMSQTIPCDDC